jgi:hypothetical protein
MGNELAVCERRIGPHQMINKPASAIASQGRNMNIESGSRRHNADGRGRFRLAPNSV